MSDDLFKASESFVENLLKEKKYQDVKKKIEDFLKLCDDKNLIKFPKPDYDELMRKAVTRAYIQMCVGLAEIEIEIAKKKNPEIITDTTFNYWKINNKINTLQHNAQEFLVDLIAILDPEKINFNVSGIGQLFSEVLDKTVGQDEQIRKELKDIFQIDMRNAFGHNDYEVVPSKITWYDKDKNPHEIELDNQEIMNQMLLVTHTINEFINSKKKVDSKLFFRRILQSHQSSDF